MCYSISFLSYRLNRSEYIKAYFVGLMDGDGSIQVNHWRRRCLQFRLVIKLKHTPYNVFMLKQIAFVLGGTVRPTSGSSKILWVVDSREAILEILEVFKQYPPLTIRVRCQLSFLIQCLNLKGTPHQNTNWYLTYRNMKYMHALVDVNPQDLLQLPYIFAWVAGFVESEGYFTLRSKSSGRFSFSMGQNTDYQLLLLFTYLFNLDTLPRLTYGNPKKAGWGPEMGKLINFYIFETYSVDSLHLACRLFADNPFLGQKYASFALFHSAMRLRYPHLKLPALGKHPAD